MNNHARHKALADRISDVMLSAFSADELPLLMDFYQPVCERAALYLLQDLDAYVSRDPASTNQDYVIVNCSTSFLAVICHRLSQSILYLLPVDHRLAVVLPQRLCAFAKKNSGIEIHPLAKIGRRFVIDHGCGTVIGETSIIGDDCYLLSNVILGARGIAANSSGKRHPTIGNNVEIGCGSRLLGPITVGDNVFIAPSCVVTEDLQDNCRVSIVNQLQVSRTAKQSARFNVTAYAKQECLFLAGELDELLNVVLVNENYEPYTEFRLHRYRWQANQAEYLIVYEGMEATELAMPMHLSLTFRHQEQILINPHGLQFVANKMIKTYKTDNNIVEVA